MTAPIQLAVLGQADNELLFYVGLEVGLLVVAVAAWRTRRKKGQDRRLLIWLGLPVATAAVVATVGSYLAEGDVQTQLQLFVVSLVLMITFVVVEQHVKQGVLIFPAIHPLPGLDVKTLPVAWWLRVVVFASALMMRVGPGWFLIMLLTLLGRSQAADKLQYCAMCHRVRSSYGAARWAWGRACHMYLSI